MKVIVVLFIVLLMIIEGIVLHFIYSRKFGKRYLEHAIRALGGYCRKHYNCDETCELYMEEHADCLFSKGLIPSDIERQMYDEDEVKSDD